MPSRWAKGTEEPAEGVGIGWEWTEVVRETSRRNMETGSFKRFEIELNDAEWCQRYRRRLVGRGQVAPAILYRENVSDAESLLR